MDLVLLELEYGRGKLTFPVPANRCLGTLRPKAAVPLGDVDSAVRAAMWEPVATVPLEQKLDGVESMLILTVDITRPTPTPLLTPVLELCRERGIEVTICIALGRHGPMTDESLRDFLTPEVYDNWEVVQHDAFDDAHLGFGRTGRGTPIKVNRMLQEHDFVCGLSFIEPSYLMGMSGGRKLIMPGIAHHTSIDANHYWLTQPGAVIGELDGNPVHLDAMEFAQRFGLDWLTCAVINGRDEIVEVIAGDWLAAHDAACRASRGIFEVERRMADIVLASPGGFPYDIDLVQGKKAIVPAAECVNPGGVVVVLTECPDGWGAEGVFREWLMHKTPEQVVRDVKVRELFSLGAHGAYILAKPIVEKGASVVLLTNGEMASQIEGSYVHTATSAGEALSLARRLCDAADPTYLGMGSARRLIVGA